MNVSFKETTYGRDGGPLIVQAFADGLHVGNLMRSNKRWHPDTKLANACLGRPVDRMALDDAREAVKTALGHTVETLDRAFGKVLGTNDAKS